MKLVLYSFAGSALVFAGMVAAYVVAGEQTFSLEALARFPFPVHFQLWAFALVFVGFAVLAGMWPFHTWAPTGHAAAPTAASMLLAGVVMKPGRLRMPARGHDALSSRPGSVGISASLASLPGSRSLLYLRPLASFTAQPSPWCKRTSNSSSAIPVSATWALSCWAS